MSTGAGSEVPVIVVAPANDSGRSAAWTNRTSLAAGSLVCQLRPREVAGSPWTVLEIFSGAMSGGLVSAAADGARIPPVTATAAAATLARTRRNELDDT